MATAACRSTGTPEFASPPGGTIALPAVAVAIVTNSADPADADADGAVRACQQHRFVFVVPWGLHHAGGVNQVVLNLAREFQQNGHFEPVIWVTDWAATTPVYFQTFGLRAMRWRLRPPPEGGPVARFRHWLWRRRVDAALTELAEGQPIAVINAHYPSAGMLTLCSFERVGRDSPSMLASFHGTDVDTLGQAPPREREHWIREVRSRLRLVVCAHDLARRLRDALREDVSVDVVLNGATLPPDAAVTGGGNPVSNGESPDGSLPAGLPDRFVLCVGRFCHRKGIDVLLDAYARLKAQMPLPDLVLVGANDVEFEPLRVLCRELGLTSRVWFVRDVPHTQVSRFYRRAVLLVLPSRSEALPLVLLEAGAYRVPVVATRVGGVSEILIDGETGLTVPPEDPARLAEALGLALTDEAAAARRAVQFHQVVSGRLSWEVASMQYRQIATSSSKRFGGPVELEEGGSTTQMDAAPAIEGARRGSTCAE